MGYLGRRIGLSQDKGNSTPGGADGAVGGGILDLVAQGYFNRQNKIYNDSGIVTNGHTATGGVISDYSTPSGAVFRAHIFTASGTFNVTATGDFGDTVEYLVVAGGGGGGGSSGSNTAPGGGGGAGGYRTSMPGGSGGGGSSESAVPVSTSPGSYPVVVGGGGNGGAKANPAPGNGTGGGRGADSTFGGPTFTDVTSAVVEVLLAEVIHTTLGPGGSGGGGGYSGSDAPGGTGTANQGYAGGISYSGGNGGGGGGGGAGAAGSNSETDPNNEGGNGGAGLRNLIAGPVHFILLEQMDQDHQRMDGLLVVAVVVVQMDQWWSTSLTYRILCWWWIWWIKREPISRTNGKKWTRRNRWRWRWWWCNLW